MTTRTLEQFAQSARRSLHEQVAARLAQVLAPESAARREKPEAVKALTRHIREASRQEVVEAVAYTWFNRFCALRYMDANHYTRVGVVSPAPGSTQPEILQEAKQGHIDPDLPLAAADRERIFDLLAGRSPARDPQSEAYRLLLVAACNSYHSPMPFLFEEIDDYSELLMPDDLLSERSILAALRAALTPEACQNVEVIGWLYQFYISEKKDEVIGAKAKIQAGDIPAATQLFTPHWIVRYLVENSLGRLWMQNRPGSRLAERMEYYIPPGAYGHEVRREKSSPEAPVVSPPDFVPLRDPTEIRLCDPAAGSGHMLTYAFDLLHAIYEEEGYPPREIPGLILTHNLYGMEIDPRAGALAAFALTMKAREKDRRFFSRGIAPHIRVLRPVHFSDAELDGLGWLQELGKNLVDLPLQEALLADLHAAAQLDTIGSLLRPRLSLAQIAEARQRMEQADDLFSQGMNDRVRAVLAQMESLARPYHIVVANPPYMGSKNQNDEIKQFLSDQYPDVKSDLFSAFIVRNCELALPGGQLGFMSPFVWMFISSYEKLREFLIDQKTITSLVQLEYSGFDGATVPICTFTLENAHHPDYKGGYVRLSDFRGSENQAPKTLEAIHNSDCGWFFRAAAADFKKIPGSPIAYWVSHNVRNAFVSGIPLNSISEPRLGMATGNNDVYVRMWHEVSQSRIGYGCNSREAAIQSGCKWFPYNKGGQFRLWYGNNEHVVDWENDGHRLQTTLHPSGSRIWAHNFNLDYIFRECLTYTATSSSYFGIRYSRPGFLFDNKGSSLFSEGSRVKIVLGYLGSKLAFHLLKAINPTIEFQPGNMAILPLLENVNHGVVEQLVDKLIALSRRDWDAYETSWDFSDLPLLRAEFRGESLAETYAALRRHWQEMTDEMQRLEEENNRLFIDAYGLHDELSPEVPLAEITLTCNPYYRYNSSKSAEELEALLLADTMREFISYAVGCMFGRYSLDKSGLILADAGQGVEDGHGVGRERLGVNPGDPSAPPRAPTFAPDADNVIPILDGDWFEDDMADRFRRFLRVTFGEARYAENLAFIEAALGRDIRSYFLREFYDDHLKRYQKRPIYWLFSSPKGSFNALIYLHRYRPDTPSVVLNEYLREFQSKLSARRRHLEGVSVSAGSTAGEKSAALREIAKLDKILAELREYESDALYPLAIRQVDLELDDGVKVNYGKLGAALKKVRGLS